MMLGHNPRVGIVDHTALHGYHRPGEDTSDIEAEITEIARLLALRHGVFGDPDIAVIRTAFIENARKPHDRLQCITIMNSAMRKLAHRSEFRLAGAVKPAMSILQANDLAGPPLVFNFLDAAGHVSRTGATEPETLQSSVWLGIKRLAGNDRGWLVFALSILDDFHAVTLTLDRRDPAVPKLFWSDQFTAGGWALVVHPENVDLLIERMTKTWWKEHKTKSGDRHSPHARLWRINPPEHRTAP